MEHNQELAATDLSPNQTTNNHTSRSKAYTEPKQAHTTYQTNKNKPNNQIIATSRPTQNHNPKKPTMPNNTPINPTRSSQPQSQEIDTNNCILSTQLTNTSSKNINRAIISLLKTFTPLPPSPVPFAKKNQANKAPDQPSIGDGNSYSPPPEQQPGVVFTFQY